MDWSPSEPRRPLAAQVGDARLVPAAVTAWVAAFVGTSGALTRPDSPATTWSWSGQVLVVVAAAVVSSVAVVAAGATGRAKPRQSVLLLVLALLVGGGAMLAAHGRVAAQASGPVLTLAADRAAVAVEVRVTADPLPRPRRPGAPAWQTDQVRVAATVLRVGPAREPSAPPVVVRTPVVVLAGQSWASLRPGDLVATSGRLGLPARPGAAAAVLIADDDPRLLGSSWSPLALGEPPRQALRDSVAGYDPHRAGLLPSLVVGDETLLTEQTREQLRVTGLAHLTAVSGANVAIVLGAVLLLARWLGVRGAWLSVVGLVSIAAFVLLARPEPSVVRAAAMGVVVVLGLIGGRGRPGGRGIAPLALAISLLLLLDPWLARSIGFALSCAATAGIVVLARPWARRAATWMPRPLAAALSVPLSAQLACTPLLVGMAGELSLSALPANLLAAPAVPAATVLGILAALVGVVAPALAHLVAGVAMLPTGWIVLVAARGADLPGTVVPWTWGVPVATLASLALVASTPAVLRSPVASVAACLALVVLLVRPGHGWPPPGWRLVACDVGQGDAVVLRTGDGEAIVADAGPDPDALDSCLDDLGVESIPLLVISHFHADHAMGVTALGRDRRVDAVLVTVVDEPGETAEVVLEWAAANDVEVVRARPGQAGRQGPVTWQVLWPARVIRGIGSAPNQASVVVRVDVEGFSVLLTGDIEPAAQGALIATMPRSLDVDVLKVPHHGSIDQHPGFVTATSPAVALVTVGQQNTYGHPSTRTLADLRAAGAVVARTDIDGDVAVVAPSGAEAQTPAALTVVRRGAR
jgi:competence protein ComEC